MKVEFWKRLDWYTNAHDIRLNNIRLSSHMGLQGLVTEKGSSALIVHGQAIASHSDPQMGHETIEITIVEMERMFENAELKKNMNGKEEDKTV